ncbi:MAG TPA: saccharopine dehydrogenase NADP-binding domain-containing protein [Thermoanaerobaculia bacterium]|nr:saccharopine dehydrogenase NADP-binding domain-containing protein [Thermoanaerobaculia bacterium]
MTAKGGLIVYGANGYTGRLIVEAALREGLRPVVAGRRREAVEPLAAEWGLNSLCFSLDDAASSAHLLGPYAAMILAAGPFSKTSAPALEACLRAGTAYLDITGEVDVFEAVFARDADAKKAGVAVLPGTGFDVVPSDCLAKALSEALPGAETLTLAFRGFKTSAGTMKTMLEGIPKGGLVRAGGQLVRVPAAWKTMEAPLGGKARLAMTIPWGDLATAFRSTGIPDIEVYMAVPPSAVASARRMRRFAKLLGLPPVQSFLKARVDKNVKGPTAEERARERSYLWGRVTKGGSVVTGTLETLEGYALTAETAISIAKRVLAGGVAPGVQTPSQAFGARFIETIRGSKLVVPA